MISYKEEREAKIKSTEEGNFETGYQTQLKG